MQFTRAETAGNSVVCMGKERPQGIVQFAWAKKDPREQCSLHGQRPTAGNSVVCMSKDPNE